MIEFNAKDWYWKVKYQHTVWSSKVGVEVQEIDTAYQAWISSGGDIARFTVDDIDELKEVWRFNNIPPYHKVRKSTVLSRLGSEKSEQAFALATDFQRLRWNAPDQPAVNADDPDVLALLSAVGADPSVVLAPEESLPIA